MGSRFIANVALLLALVAQGTALVHLGVVRHERCAEHGDLVDVAHDEHEARDATPHDTLFGGEAAHGEDDHCDVAFRVARDVVVQRVPVDDVEAVVVVVADVAVDAGEAEARAIAVLALAPKTGPPAA